MGDQSQVVCFSVQVAPGVMYKENSLKFEFNLVIFTTYVGISHL